MISSVIRRVLVVSACALTACSCIPLPEYPFLPGGDITPPSITRVGLEGPSRLMVGFDEPVRLVGESVSGIPGTEARVVADAEMPSVRFDFASAPDAGVEHHVEAQVADHVGNNLRFVARFYGLNAFLPAMVINEFTTQGSSTHPDIVEIRALTDGNIAGACLYEGTPGNWTQRFVFPSVDVTAGDFLVVHFKPQGIDEEIDETAAMGQSGGIDATDTAWDFWVPDGSGLSGNNGVLSLCENPLGGFVDVVAYSNRSSTSDEAYLGFGSRDMLERMSEVWDARAWRGKGSEAAPEDCVNPDDSTSTRSIARGAASADTDRREDWHITPTRGITVGSENTDEVYVK